MVTCPTCGGKGQVPEATDKKPANKRGTRSQPTAEEWRALLPGLFPGVNIDEEMAKARRWIVLHPGRMFTRRFVENWLGKADRVVEAAGDGWTGISVGDHEADKRELAALQPQRRRA